LADVIATVSRQMHQGRTGSKKIPLAFIGGLFSHNPIYRQRVRAAMKRKSIEVSIREPEVSPVVGAALMAARLLKA